MIWETILGQVISKANNYLSVPSKDGERRIVKSERMRSYEESFALQCKLYRDKNIDKPFIFHIVVYESSWSYDLDNALKSVLDILQYCRAISNDNLCVGINARKVIDRQNPRVVYAIEETEPKIF